MKAIYKTIQKIDNAETGNLARIERVRHGYTLKDVSSKMGFSEMYLSKLERGTTAWSEKRVLQFNEVMKGLIG